MTTPDVVAGRPELTGVVSLQEPLRPITVSIGLPVFNAERYVWRAIDSILGQTYENWQLIISDNCSTDGTAQICRAYAEKDRRITYVRQSRNLGLYPNFHFVSQLAAGKYFVWRAADDELEPTFLQESVDAFERDPSLSLVAPRAEAIGPSGEHLHGYDWLKTGRHEGGDCVAQFKGLYREFGLDDVWTETDASGMKQWGGSAPLYIFAMMRTEMLRRMRPLGSHMRADETFICQLSLWGRVLELPAVLSRIRIHDEAASRLVVEWDAGSWQRVQDPRSASGLRLWVATHWWHVEHLLCISSAPIPLRAKARLYWFIATHMASRVMNRLARIGR